MAPKTPGTSKPIGKLKRTPMRRGKKPAGVSKTGGKSITGSVVPMSKVAPVSIKTKK